MRFFNIRATLLSGVGALSVAAVQGCATDPIATEKPIAAAKLPVVAAEEFTAVSEDAALGLARVRVNLVARDGAAARSAITVEDLKLCQQAICFQYHREVAASDTAIETDSGVTLADLALPDGELTQLVVRLRDDAQGAASDHALVLAEPLLVETGIRTELFLELADGASAPRFLAAAPVPPDAKVTAVVEPGRAAELRTDSGFVLELAPRSVLQSTVVAVSEDAVGGASPQFAIWPREPLDAPARVTLPLDYGRIPAGLSLADYRARLNNAMLQVSLEPAVEQEHDAVQFEIGELGDLALATRRAYAELADGTFMMPQPVDDGGLDSEIVDKADTTTCRNRLTANMPGYLTTLRSTRGIRITDCEGVAPFVHIVLVNLAMTGLPAGTTWPKVVFPTAARNAAGQYPLRTLSEHMASVLNPVAGINGFTWSGGSGSSADHTGTFNGTVFIGASQVGFSSSNESIIGFSNRSAGAGTTTGQYAKTGSVLPELPPNHWHAVGSTTSIYRNSACTRVAGGEVNRWSAIGIGNGRLAMVSSTSGGTTEAFDLCTVFGRVGSTGAIRLDGGPSTSIYWNGTVLNPLTGAARLVYGAQRRILYPVAGIR